MLTSTLVAFALMRLAAPVAAADPLVDGAPGDEIPDDVWTSVMDSFNATSNATFSGYDITKPYPGSPQDGWQLSIAIKEGVDDPTGDGELTATAMSLMAPDGSADKVDDSWALCLHVFTVNVASADTWGSGTDPSCKGLVANECIDDLQKNAIKNFGDGCPSFSTTPSCLRDLEEQKSMSLAVGSADAKELLGNSSFYRRVDGVADATTYEAASMQPVALITVFGSSGDSDEKPNAVAACVMPGATPVEGAAAGTTAFMGWTVFSMAVALGLLL